MGKDWIMAFGHKRLAVQLPCGETTVVEPAVQADIVMPCIGGLSCDLGRSGWVPCAFTNRCAITCGWSCEITDPWALAYRAPGTVVVDSDQLPVLRAQLEVQLKQLEERLGEVGVAEQAVERREADS